MNEPIANNRTAMRKHTEKVLILPAKMPLSALRALSGRYFNARPPHLPKENDLTISNPPPPGRYFWRYCAEPANGAILIHQPFMRLQSILLAAAILIADPKSVG